MASFLPFHSSSDELEQVLQCRGESLGKILPESHLFVRRCPQKNSTHILRYFNNFSLVPFI